MTKITNQVSGNYEMKYPLKMNNRVTIVYLYIGYTCSMGTEYSTTYF